MRKFAQIVIPIVTVVPLVMLMAFTVSPPVSAAAPQEKTDPFASMPEGAGKKLVIQSCTKCHAVTNITKQQRDADGWTQTIVKMVGYGATGSDEDFEEIVNYLAKNYGPGSAPPPATHTRILVNKETAEQLSADLGLTADEGAALVTYRAKNGDFKTIDDLKKVSGVDGKKLDAHAEDLQF